MFISTSSLIDMGYLIQKKKRRLGAACALHPRPLGRGGYQGVWAEVLRPLKVRKKLDLV